MSFAVRYFSLVLVTGVCLMGAGCARHKAMVVVPAAPITPVPLASAPEPSKPPVMSPVPLTPTPVTAVQIPEKKKARKKKVAVVVAPTVPAQVASSGAPTPDSREVIGALTAGGGADPAKKQHANEMIGDLDKRLATLPVDLLEKQKDGVARVRYFAREARTALDSGDADGAVTLATKAKLLLDEMVKPA